MQYPLFDVDGFEGHELVVDLPHLFSVPRLLLDGQPVPVNHRTREWELQRDNGQRAAVEFRPRILDPLPIVRIDGVEVPVGESIPWQDWLWAAIPLLLIGLDPLLGSVLGLSAFALNIRLYRANLGDWERYLAVLVVAGIALGLYFLILNRFTRLVGV